MENSPVIPPDAEIHHHHHNSNARSSSRRSHDHPHGGAIEQQLKWAPPFHTVFKFLIPYLLGVVAVKYQAKSKDPIETRPLQTWSSLAAIFIYSLILLALKQMKNHHNKYFEMSIRISVASGVLSNFSLLSLLLPHVPGLLLLYASWALSTIIAIWPLLQCTYNWLLRGFTTLANILISRARIWFTGSNSEPPVLPI